MPHDEDIQEPTREELVHIGSFPDVPSAQEHALVVLAMGQPCWVWQDDLNYSLHVLPEAANAIHTELTEYAREQHDQAERNNTPQLPLPNHPPGWGLYALWTATLVATFILQQRIPTLTSSASSSCTHIIDLHQWWRPFTALFLHADSAHLLGNLLSGLFFMILVSRSIGPLRGWLATLACGTLGNIATALSTYPGPFSSIGASTAVFAALGILSGIGLSLMLRHRLQLPWLRIISPVLGGIIILGMIGAGQPGDNTDVLGHLFGFASGLLFGLIQGLMQQSSGIHRVPKS